MNNAQTIAALGALTLSALCVGCSSTRPTSDVLPGHHRNTLEVVLDDVRTGKDQLAFHPDFAEWATTGSATGRPVTVHTAKLNGKYALFVCYRPSEGHAPHPTYLGELVDVDPLSFDPSGHLEYIPATYHEVTHDAAAWTAVRLVEEQDKRDRDEAAFETSELTIDAAEQGAR